MTLDVFMDKIVLGDCVSVMRDFFPDNSIHAVITDPPYGLEFMGEEWDSFKEKGQSDGWQIAGEPSLEKFDGRNDWHSKPRPAFRGHDLAHWKNYQLWTTTWATEAFRVLMPGGALLSMGGTRTYHRMACGVEDAGFLIKDCLLWVYNQGFPKAQDLGKMIDKREGMERNKRPITYRKFEDITGGKFNRQDGKTESTKVLYESEPATDLAKKWDGWKVGGLKPAYEPVIFAIKPPEGSYTENVLKYGIGAINVDGCRIPYESEDDRSGWSKTGADGSNGYKGTDTFKIRPISAEEIQERCLSTGGRYPANIILTDPVFDADSRFFLIPKANSDEERWTKCEVCSIVVPRCNLDSHQVHANFCFDCKILFSNKETDRRLHKKHKTKSNLVSHPTVKPIELMKHLITLVTREGQTVLDPFGGSGTTAVACRLLNRHSITIEISPEYSEIAKKRLANIPPPIERFLA